MKKLISLLLCMLILCLFVTPVFAATDRDVNPPVAPGEAGGRDEPTIDPDENDFYDVELNTGEDYISVNWKCTLENTEEFRVWIANAREKVDERYFDKKNSVDGDGNTYTFTSLEDSKTYYIMIDAVVDGTSVSRSKIYEATTKLGAPTLRMSTESIIAIQYREGYEYRIDGGAWRKSNVFTGLDEYTEYSFEWKNTSGEIAKASVFATLCAHPSTHDEFSEERGLMTEVCDVCGQVVSAESPEHEPHEHVGREYETTSPPSCIKEGVSRLFCEICGEVMSERIIDKTPHTYSVEYEDEEGNIIKHCIDCGTVQVVKEKETPPVDENVATSGDITAIIGKNFVFGYDAVLEARGITDDPGAENVLGSKSYNKAVREIRRQLKCRGLLFYEIGVYDTDGEDFGESSVSIKISTERFTGSSFYVYEILPDGTVSDCGAIYSDNALVFAKRSNGVYAVVDTTGYENAKSSSNAWLVIVLIITAIFLGGAGYAAHYIYSSIRRKKSREWLNDNPDMSDQK